MGDERVRMDGGEGSMGKGTRMMVWALVFGLLVLFLGAVADVVCLLMDWEEEIIVPIVRAIASAGFICLLGGKKMYQLDKDKVRDAWKFALPVVLINIAIVVLLLVGQIIGAITGKVNLNPKRLCAFSTLRRSASLWESAKRDCSAALSLAACLPGWARTRTGPLSPQSSRAWRLASSM